MASTFLIFFLISANFLFIRTQSQFEDQLFHAGFADGDSEMSFDKAARIQKNGILTLIDHSARLSYGHAFHKFPFQFRNSSNGRAFSFSTTFAFIVIPEAPNFCGSGFTFAIAPSPSFVGLPREYLGLPNFTQNGNFSKHLFAVEFDTFQDSRFQDIDGNHIGVDIGSFVSKAAIALQISEREYQGRGSLGSNAPLNP
ncbi:L-type lectin-domain containing receptor kinase S.4-like [Momordica charantia]|uniref:L-type lectin-domain containing receptor kinase S.4-like n=1 Tax=Momordica charantia TaxID=3673 RepID=A0A6J1CRV1_MOMCH|nr:L-type lectin-domain containing receptor kinase S.4-like [Momordica charantia]